MKEQMLDQVKQAILDYQMDEIEDIVKEAIDEGLTPSDIMDTQVEAMREIGDGYEKGELYLPDMIGAADTMQASLPILEEEFKKSDKNRESLGVALIGSVAGDIHTIGKSMVIAMLIAEGFEVRDLGVDISTEQFVEAVRENKPVLLAMSALLSTTAPEAQKVIEALKKEGLRENLKVIVGGGAVSADFANQIGADGYDDTAPGGATLARKLVTQ